MSLMVFKMFPSDEAYFNVLINNIIIFQERNLPFSLQFIGNKSIYYSNENMLISLLSSLFHKVCV